MIVENPFPGEMQRRKDAPHGRGREAIAVGGCRAFQFCKQVFEIGLSVAMLFVAVPVVAVAAILVKLTSQGPVFYSQTRTGRHGKPFTIYKIRTMYHNCERATGVRWAMPGDPRITPVGWFLRRTHVDELPQLWNVLRGDMSLVGPRPERPEFIPQLEEAIAHYTDRLLIRPGLTGLAQVQLPPDTDLASVRRKLAYDLYYIQHMGFWLEARIYVATALHLVAIPFRIIRKLCWLPPLATVERAYDGIQVHLLRPRELPSPEAHLVRRAVS